MRFLFISLILVSINCYSQSDQQMVEKACLNYIEGFYEGDTTKIIAGIRPSLNKFGFWKSEGKENYELDGYMTFEQAKAYADRVRINKRFTSSDAPKKVEILDVSNVTAAAKITAWWGIDYVLLSKNEGTWKIEQVVWEGPLEK